MVAATPEAFCLDHVRNLAQAAGLDEIYFNQRTRVISFGLAPGSATRVNVYYATGTVTTCVGRNTEPAHRVFRARVTPSQLTSIFADRRLHLGGGCQHRSQRMRRELCAVCLDKASQVRLVCAHDQLCWGCAEQLRRTNDGHVSCPICRTLSPLPGGNECEPRDEETEAVRQRQRLQREAAAIAEQMREVDGILELHRMQREAEAARVAEELRLEEEERAEEQRQREAEEAAQREAEELERAAAERAARGSACTFHRLAEPEDVNMMMGACATHVATNGEGTVFLYEDGKWAHTAGLPRQLVNKLNGRARHHPVPTYVALGTQARYYIGFDNGKSEGVGPEALTKLLKQSRERVQCVAFGEGWDSFFVVFTDGSWQARDMPKGLEELIEKRGKRTDIQKVSLGPSGEWFCQAKNGRCWWGGVSEGCSADIQAIGAANVTFIDFGADGSYFIRRVAQ